MPATGVVPLEQLTALFAGDEITRAHPTDALAEAICRLAHPGSFTDLQAVIYGAGWPADLISLREDRAMRRGFRAWAQAGRPQEGTPDGQAA